jgi:uncharacterized protein YciI
MAAADSRVFVATVGTVLFIVASVAAQSSPSSSTAGKDARLEEHKMTTYYLVLLKRASSPPAHDPEQLETIHAQHIAYLEKLGADGFGMAAGPFADDGPIGGITILRATSAEHARELHEEDPAVKAGRLAIEVVPFMAPEGWFRKPDTPFQPDQLFFGFLVNGSNRSQDKETAARLQAEHLAYMTGQADAGRLVLAGPIVLKESERRGVIAYRAKTFDEAKALAEGDPMVKAGRLAVELHPWTTARGIFK